MRERVQSKKQCAYYGMVESVIVSEVISEIEMHACKRVVNGAGELNSIVL